MKFTVLDLLMTELEAGFSGKVDNVSKVDEAGYAGADKMGGGEDDQGDAADECEYSG